MVDIGTVTPVDSGMDWISGTNQDLDKHGDTSTDQNNFLPPLPNIHR